MDISDMYLVLPGTCTVGVCTLVAGVDVDQNTAITIVVNGALAVASTTETGEGDVLASETTV